MDLKFQKCVAVPVEAEVLPLTEEVWRKIRRCGNQEVNGNLLTAYLLNKEKLFMLGDSEDCLVDGTRLHLGEYIVIMNSTLFVYKKEQFEKLFVQL